MNYSQKNIFNLENPQAYSCSIIYYRYNHSLLCVRVNPNDSQLETFYLTFGAVEYFEGPLGWNGANFCIAADDECAKLSTTAGLDVHLYLEHYRLYVIKQPHSEVKIVAGENVTKTPNITGDFIWKGKVSIDD